MDKNLIMAIGVTLVPLVMALVFGYWAWVSYSGFISSVFFVSNWDNFNLMIVTLLISGFFAGLSAAIIAIVSSIRSDARKKQEKQKLKEEVKRELEMESQKQVIR